MPARPSDLVCSAISLCVRTRGTAGGVRLFGEPFELILDGSAGGKFSQGIDGERVEMNAIEFIRVLAGRRTGTGILRNPLPL